MGEDILEEIRKGILGDVFENEREAKKMKAEAKPINWQRKCIFCREWITITPAEKGREICEGCCAKLRAKAGTMDL